MAKSNLPKPLLIKQWAKHLVAREASPASEELNLQMQSLWLPNGYQKGVDLSFDEKSRRADITVKTRMVGQHAFPPDIKSISLSPRSALRMEVAETHGAIHKHLGVSSRPAKLSRELQVRQRFSRLDKKADDSLMYPTTIFEAGQDERYVFDDTAFPWSACGRVETAAGWGSGVMIGPRHMMTASHVIPWKPNNSAGWIQFAPLKFDNSEPFGHANVTQIYSWNKADPSDLLDLTEGAFDYVVCVLDRPIGDATGFMGSRGYTTDWNNGDYWGHVGYPMDLSGGTRPAFIGFQRFLSTETASLGGRDSFRISHKIDVIPGQSGGPYFGMWAGEPWPRVVGIQSGQTAKRNSCGGGNPLSELINIARTENP